MSISGAEWRGTAAAFAGHAALIAALSLSLATVETPVEPPSINVEFVDEIGLEPAARVQQSAPATQATTPDPAIPDEPAPPEPDAPPPPPEPRAAPPERRAEAPKPRAERPRPQPRQEPRKEPRQEPRAEAPAPRQEPARPRRPRPTGALDDLQIDGAERGNTSRRADAETGQASAPTISSADIAGIQQAIRRQIQPCANRQINPGPGANQISVKVNVRLARDGRLTRPPRIVGTTGVNADNERFEARVKDLAIAAYQGCAPLTGLPAELYQTPQGGWSNIDVTYRLP